MRRINLAGALLLLATVCFWSKGIWAEAGTIYTSPYVTFAPDGRAWTTDAGNTEVEWYREGGADDIATGRTSLLAALKTGQHYYTIARKGNIPISYWRVQLDAVNCCHMDYPSGEYHGIPYAKKPCLKPHFSAWYPVCADCGEPITRINFYMSRAAAASIDQLEVGTKLDYYYLCPFNNNLEQGTPIYSHDCKAISANRYRVDYLPNTGGEPYAGYMAPSFHFYDNATSYEGREVTPQTHLSRNTFQRIGWKFMGWNTKADGSGVLYSDEAEIYNLCAEQYDPEGEQGRVQLYAVWQQCSGQLDLVLEDCFYKGHTGRYSVTKTYGESYELETDELDAPAGYLVTFDAKGGESVSAIRGTQHFTEWLPVNSLQGKLEGKLYWFIVPDENVDVVRPAFERDAVTLPKSVKTGKSFGGWYYDEDYTQFAGGEGDRITPTGDICLYARWVELSLEATDNYASYEGTGAVDLQWSQPDSIKKVYQLFQSSDGQSWQQIYTADTIGGATVDPQTYTGSSSQYTYIVPLSGYYKITAYGAQGGDFENYSGGKGGEAQGVFWLEQGEEVQVKAGLQYGDSNGGKGNPYADGGGCSIVSTNTKGTLLVAGGGGGAGANGNGLPGGSSQNLVDQGQTGESGGSGGGGGYLGGRAGELIVHHHVAGTCNHVHEGKSAWYGGCYTIPVLCGRELEHVLTGSIFWYWGGPDEEYCPNCGADASKGETCCGHETEYYSHICPIHGEQAENAITDKPANCRNLIGFAVGCGRTEDYICGYEEGQILSSKPAYGGSSYVNTEMARDYSTEVGSRAGTGIVYIQPESIGYQSQTSLQNVKAADRNAPERINGQTVERTVTGTDVIRVQWKKPEDLGTIYFHQAKSYELSTGANIGISNVTANTLTSGVKGYYYCVDNTSVREYAQAEFAYTNQTEMQVVLTNEQQFLHVAAVDVAGNIGELQHISLGSRQIGPSDAEWKLHTEPLRIETGNYVYEDIRRNLYFVKCDGKTSFVLNFASYMEGAASANFQMNYAIIESWPEGEGSSQNMVFVPSDDAVLDKTECKAEGLRFIAKGASKIQDGDYVIVNRANYGK